MEAADVDDNAGVDLTDAVFLLLHLFRGGAPPVHPGPDHPCALDFDGDAVDCLAYPEC